MISLRARQLPGLPAVATVLLLLLLPSCGASGWSWEGARAAAKDSYQRNLQLAGLRKHHGHDALVAVSVAGPSDPAATSSRLEVPAAEAPCSCECNPASPAAKPAGTTCVAAPALGAAPARTCAGGAAAEAAEDPAEYAASHEGQQDSSKEPGCQQQQQPRQDAAGGQEAPAGFGWLVTHLLAFLLGWLLKASNQQQQQQQQPTATTTPQAVGKGSDTAHQQVPAAANTCSNTGQPAAPQTSHRAEPLQKQQKQEQQQWQGLNPVDGELPTAGVGRGVSAPAGDHQQPSPSVSSSSSRHHSEEEQDADAPAGQGLAASWVMLGAPAAASKDTAIPACKEGQGDDAASSTTSSATPPPQPAAAGATAAAAAALDSSAHAPAHGMQQQQQQQLACIQQAPSQIQQQQVPLQLIITAPAEVVAVIGPAASALHQLACGVQHLAPVATLLVCQVQQASSMLHNLTARLDRLLAWAKGQQQEAALAAQQQLAERAGQLGQMLLLLCLGLAALRLGRVWEVHQVCQLRAQQQQGSWQQRVTGTRDVFFAWRYTSCGAEQLGLYAIGLLVLYMVVRASLAGLMQGGSGRQGSGASPSRAWQVDLLLTRGVLFSLVGAHVVHCLGAAWLPWVLGWLLWCGCQVLLNARPLRGPASMLLVLCVAVALPLAVGVLPFHAKGFAAQGVLLEAFPVLGRLPSVSDLSRQLLLRLS